MITDCFDIETEPIISLKDFYGEQKHIVYTCLIIFSDEIHKHLLKRMNVSRLLNSPVVTAIYRFIR